MKDYPHLISRVFNTPLLIVPKKANTIIAGLATRLRVAAEPLAPAPIVGWDDDDYESEPRPLFATHPAGIAVIGMIGTLAHQSATAAPPSGMTGYAEISAALDAAVADPSIRAILLSVDSPGGEASESAFALADQIHAARRNKLVWAVADEMACSAAYLVASAASRVLVPDLGYIGSIGVYALHLDMSGRDKQQGLAWTYIFAGAHKIDGNPHEPLGGETRKEIQADVDATYERFLQSVGQSRPSLGADGARRTEAKVLRGSEAVAAGLADGVMDFRAALAALTESLDGSSTMTGLRPRAEAQPATQETEMSNPAKPAGTPAPAATTQQPTPIAGQPPAPPAAAADGNVVQLDAARAEGEQRALAYMQEVTDLCTLAGVPQKAAEFIGKKAAVADVRKALVDARAATADAAQIAGRHAADAGAGTQVPTIDAGSIYAARAKSMGQAS